MTDCTLSLQRSDAMNVVLYAVLAYAATAVISFGVITVIVGLNRVFSAPGEESDND